MRFAMIFDDSKETAEVRNCPEPDHKNAPEGAYSFGFWRPRRDCLTNSLSFQTPFLVGPRIRTDTIRHGLQSAYEANL